MSTYEQDFAKAVQKQSDLIVQRVFIELIQLVTESETYEDFRKRMYALAKDVVENVNYDADVDINGMKKLVHENNLIGIADRYISEL